MIRTYSRRTQECELIEGVEKCCRLCLGSQPSVPIYTSTEICSLLATRIMMVVGLEISKDTYLPNAICEECHRQIEKCYSFRKMCEVAYHKLKMHLQAVKIKEANQLSNDTNKQYSSLQKSKQYTVIPDHGNTLRSDLGNTTENDAAADSLKKGTEIKANLKDDNKDYVDLVLVVNENNVKLLEDSQIDVNKTMEFGDLAVEKKLLKDWQLPGKSMQQSVLKRKQFIKPNMTLNDKIGIDYEVLRQDSQGLPENPQKSIQECQPQFIQEISQQPIQNVPQQSLQEIPYQSVQELPQHSIQESSHQIKENMPHQSKHEIPQDSIQEIAQQEGPNPVKQEIQNQPPENQQLSEQDSPQLSIEESMSVFITTELLETDMLRVTGRDKLVLNPEVDMVLELLAGDGSLLTLDVMEESEEDDKAPNDPTVVYDSELRAENLGFLTIKQPATESLNTAKRKTKAPRVHACTSCPKQFSKRSTLERHQLVHSGERPYRCRHCPRAFGQREVCTRHELTHAERRPFPCPSCPKSFTQRGALTSHVRSHAPPSARSLLLHACGRCPKVFLYASGLTRHMKTHAGERFTCEACLRIFTDKSSLRRHVAKHPPTAT